MRPTSIEQKPLFERVIDGKDVNELVVTFADCYLIVKFPRISTQEVRFSYTPAVCDAATPLWIGFVFSAQAKSMRIPGVKAEIHFSAFNLFSYVQAKE